MRFARPILCALLLASAAATAQQQPSQSLNDLSGLWSAKKFYGPEVRGELIVERTAGGLRADIAGRSAAVAAKGNRLSFQLPGDQGSFSGRFDGQSVIHGLWTRGPTDLYDGRSSSPVELKAIGGGRWAGTVDPGEDEFSFYIFAKRAPDGSYAVTLRNPEFDLGNQQGVRRLVRDGDALKLMAQRGTAPERLYAAGRMQPDLDGFSLTFPGRGGTYDFHRDGASSLVYPRPRTDAPYRYIPPPALSDGWPVATLRAEGIDQPAMEKLVQSIIDMNMEEPDAPEIHAILVARHGRLLLEEYFHGFSREELHNIRSAGKSLTATAIGAAMHSGTPLRLDSRLYQVMNGGTFPEGLEPRKRAMTLENLMTMSSGHYCDDTDDKAPGNEDYMSDVLQERDLVKYSLGVPMATDPGTNSVYCSMQPNLALAMLGEAAGENPVETFDRLVARPMQITNYAWGIDPSGQPYGGGGSAIRARDFMKFGQLMLNGGTWNGKRILDAGFVRAASAPQYHLRNVYYGYYWWVEDYPYKNRTVRAYSARGSGGTLVYVVPELDLVMETMAGNYSNRRGMKYLGNLIANAILPAVREKGDYPNAPVTFLDRMSPYGPSKDGSRVSRP
jgi:CubicO group peptidase (beta-lactamase class C family)